MEKKKVPGKIILISTVAVLMGLYHILNAVMIFNDGRMLMGYETPDTFQLLGLIWMGIGLYSLVISIGLDYMKIWARVQGRHFFLYSGIFCLAMYFTDIILVPIGIIYLIFFMYLGNIYIVQTFEAFEYNKLSIEDIEIKQPSIMKVLHGKEGEAHSPSPKQEGLPVESKIVPVKEEKQRKVRVPETMIKCPNCEMLNPIDTVFCVRCAFDIDQLNKLVREAFKSAGAEGDDMNEDENEDEDEAPSPTDNISTDSMQRV